MTDPWEGFDPEQACWSHFRNEPRTRRTFIVCFECGHVYTRWSLWKAWVRTGRRLRRWNEKHPAPFQTRPESRFSVWRRIWLTPPSRIYHCQECVHDF